MSTPAFAGINAASNSLTWKFKIGREDNFDWWIVEENVPSNLISDCEQKLLVFYNSVFLNGYNKTFGGIGNITVSEYTRAKIRENALARDFKR